MSLISGKRKKTPTENNEIAPGISRDQVSKTNFLSSCKEISLLCVHGLEKNNKTVTYITCYIIRPGLFTLGAKLVSENGFQKTNANYG